MIAVAYLQKNGNSYLADINRLLVRAGKDWQRKEVRFMANTQVWQTERHNRSYYINRYHDESGYPHWEFQCPCCKGKFDANISNFAYEYRERGDFAQIYCPYCGERYEVAT